jgi:hypothetical protein
MNVWMSYLMSGYVDCLGGWIDEWMDGRLNEWVERWMDGNMEGWLHDWVELRFQQIDGWMDGWCVCGRMDGWNIKRNLGEI